MKVNGVGELFCKKGEWEISKANQRMVSTAQIPNTISRRRIKTLDTKFCHLSGTVPTDFKMATAIIVNNSCLIMMS
jgi:hypothetical protein